MLTREQLTFLLELCHTQGVAVPMKSARLAADTIEEIYAQRDACEPSNPPPGS